MPQLSCDWRRWIDDQVANPVWIGLARRYLPPPRWGSDDWTDIVSEAMTRLLYSLARGSCVETPGAWLRQVIIRLCIDHARHAQWTSPAASSAVGDDEVADPAPVPLPGDGLAWDLFVALDDLAARGVISDANRVLFRLHYEAGVDEAELARRHGVTRAAICDRLRRVRQHLAGHSRLRGLDEDGECADGHCDRSS